MNVRFLSLVASTALLATLAMPADAAGPQGQWSGVIQQANTDVRVDATFGAAQVDLRFDEPFACRISASFVTTRDTANVYRFKPSVNGGRFCDDLTSKEFTVKPAPPKAGEPVTWLISFSSKRADWTGRLQQAP